MANAKRTAAKPTTTTTTATTTVRTSIPAKTLPLAEDAIRARAYEIWRRRGGVGGSPEEDWAQAQRELSLELRPPM